MKFTITVVGYSNMLESIGWCMQYIGSHFFGWSARYIHGSDSAYVFEFDNKADYDLFKTEFMLRFG